MYITSARCKRIIACLSGYSLGLDAKTGILPIFLYRSECWAITKVDVCRIVALDHWCLRTLLGIKWHQFVRNEEVRTTKQPNLTMIIQSRHFSIFGHTARMDDDADAKMILTAPPPENWKRPPGHPHITWLNTIQRDLRDYNLTLKEAVDLTQNRSLWRLMSTYGAMHSKWCMPGKKNVFYCLIATVLHGSLLFGYASTDLCSICQ